MNRKVIARVADAIEAFDAGYCYSPSNIAGCTIETLGPPKTRKPFAKAVELLGLTDNRQINILLAPTADVTGYNYRCMTGDGHITRAHAVAALRDLAAGGACDDTLWERTSPGRYKGCRKLQAQCALCQDKNIFQLWKAALTISTTCKRRAPRAT